MNPQVLVVGAGPGGLALAQGLWRAGIGVHVVERERWRSDTVYGFRLRLRGRGVDALRSLLPPALFAAFERTCGRAPTQGLLLDEALRPLPPEPLPADHFALRYTGEPLVLFRIFQYPSRAVPTGVDALHGVGEHTDYGLLTLLRQDDVGGLQVKLRHGDEVRWVEAPPVPGSFVCNIGDMLDRMTGGLYRSTPHRVRLNTSGRHRLSLPLFFDPDFDARIEAIRTPATDDHASRWDGASVHAFEGSYGDYVLAKVGKVFPALRAQVLDGDAAR